MYRKKGGRGMKIIAVGDRAVTVEFGNEISREINQQVMRLHESLQENPLPGIIETVPSYAALMIHYRPEIIDFKQLQTALGKRRRTGGSALVRSTKITEIPVLYGGEKGLDLEACAAGEGISTEEFIRIHSGHDYYVYMLGFAPGHPYTARFAEPFSCKRRATPRLRAAGGTIVAVDNLSNILPFDQPCGWPLIGHTPVKLCDYAKPEPFLLRAGQWIRFKPVDEREYQAIARQVEQGIYRVNEDEKVVESWG